MFFSHLGPQHEQHDDSSENDSSRFAWWVTIMYYNGKISYNYKQHPVRYFQKAFGYWVCWCVGVSENSFQWTDEAMKMCQSVLVKWQQREVLVIDSMREKDSS